VVADAWERTDDLVGDSVDLLTSMCAPTVTEHGPGVAL
jgi:predicted site-specific integrase-resolvase